MSLWADYNKELFGDSKTYIEYEWGFIEWSLPEWALDCILIENLYVIPSERLKGRGKELFNEVCEIGKKAGRKYVICQLELKSMVQSESIKAHLAVGLLPIAANDNKILMRKPL